MSHVEPHVHEAKCFLHFRDHGLSPYWAVRNLLIHELDGSGYLKTEIAGEEYEIKLGYSDSGIAPRPSDNVERDVLRDYELHVEPPGEDTEAKCHYQIRARFDDMKGPDGTEKSIPWEGGEGIDVLAQSSNIPLDQIPFLLRSAIGKLAESVGFDLSFDYFTSPRRTSKITTCEYYVRICRDESRKLVDPDGILHRIMYLLSPVEGTEWVYKGDNTDIVGNRHAMDLPPGSMSELGMYTTGIRLKAYHPKHVRDEEDEDDPLSSPKYGAAYHKSIDGNSRLFHERDKLKRELEEILVNTMEWAGIPTEPDDMIFVDDDHFSVEESDTTIGRESDPTPQIEQNQECLLMSVIGELSPSGRDLTTELVADGGSTHYETLAEKTDSSISTIYRVLDEMKGIVESDRGMIKFTSQKIREEIVGMVDRLNELKESTAERVAQLANVDLRSQAGSAIDKWCAKYAAEISGLGDGETIRIDTLLTRFKSFDEPTLEAVLREALDAWISTGRARADLEDLRVEAELVEGGAVGQKVVQILH